MRELVHGTEELVAQEAQETHLSSMRIAPDPLASSAHEGEIRVQLRMELSNWALPQHTLLVHTSPQCVKTFHQGKTAIFFIPKKV